jgi:acetolactate decarboxylase
MNKLSQYATITGLANGNYDGQFKLEDILKGKNFGLGTFEAVDGELIGFDNRFYRIRSDGSVTSVKSKDLTPFASLTDFKNPILLSLPVDANKRTLLEILKQEVNPNRVYALKINGSFSEIETRTLAKQAKPYPKLVDATKTQAVVKKTNQKGTIVGYLSPELFDTILVEGLHLHFLNKEKTFGGHVLNFLAQEVKLEIIELDQIDLVFDQTKKPMKVNRQEIEKAEN